MVPHGASNTPDVARSPSSSLVIVPTVRYPLVREVLRWTRYLAALEKEFQLTSTSDGSSGGSALSARVTVRPLGAGGGGQSGAAAADEYSLQ